MTSTDVPRLGVRWTAVTMLAVEIAIHVALAPAHLHEVPYIGALFVAASILLAIALIGVLLTPTNALAWWLGAALCAGMAAAFVISRTFGLPDYHEGWSSDSGLGLISLPPEVLFMVCRGAMRRPSGMSTAGHVDMMSATHTDCCNSMDECPSSPRPVRTASLTHRRDSIAHI